MSDRRNIVLSIVVAALGYFVDIYDLILFSIVRKKSLIAIGVPEAELLDQGVMLLNMQMGGMLLGGILWGVLGDKRGRLSVLFGSIALYSIANIGNGFVTSVPMYAALRFIAGIGLAGELGAGITLVSEIMHKESRGYGTTIIAGVGVMGAIVAVAVGDYFDWRIAYFVGGGMGLLLLLLRIGIYESNMFRDLKTSAQVTRGNFFQLFTPWPRAVRYISVVCIGVPIWYVIGILITFSPEMGSAMGMIPAPEASHAVMWCYIGLAVGDVVSGVLSQLAKSRKRIVGSFLVFMALAVTAYFSLAHLSLSVFYSLAFLLGCAGGYWAVFVTIASEQFGTNIRATATTTAPNFVRGTVVLLTTCFQLGAKQVGIKTSALFVGVVVLSVALLALRNLDETYGRDLDFLDH